MVFSCFERRWVRNDVRDYLRLASGVFIDNPCYPAPFGVSARWAIFRRASAHQANGAVALPERNARRASGQSFS